jgi:hypothetical protein
MYALLRIMKPATLLCAVLMLGQSAFGQKVDSYISDMGEALVPYGTLNAQTCHSILIQLHGPWANYAIPDGIEKDSSDKPTWTVVKADVIRLYLNLSNLDADKVQNYAVFSLDYIGKHQKGTRYVADTPAVMLFASGLNAHMTVNTVDLEDRCAPRAKPHHREPNGCISR